MPMRASAHGWGIKDREESYYPMVGDNVSLRLTPNLTLTHARMHYLQRLSLVAVFEPRQLLARAS